MKDSKTREDKKEEGRIEGLDDNREREIEVLFLTDTVDLPFAHTNSLSFTLL